MGEEKFGDNIENFVSQEHKLEEESQKPDYTRTIDKRGRIIIPLELRKELQEDLDHEEEVMIIKTAENVAGHELFRICTHKEWQDLENKAKERSKDFQRMFYANTFHTKIRSQGRVRVPDEMITGLDLEKAGPQVGIIEKEKRIYIYLIPPDKD